MVYYRTKFQNLTLNGTNVASTSEVCSHQVGITYDRKLEYKGRSGILWHDIHTKFYENESICLQVIRGWKKPSYDNTSLNCPYNMRK
jgi:hypothetical protein